MEISMPDPYPGRCRNHRTKGLATARCIDYDGTEHVCSFPDLDAWRRDTVGAGVYTNQRTTIPWVKPERANTQEGT